MCVKVKMKFILVFFLLTSARGSDLIKIEITVLGILEFEFFVFEFLN